VSPFAAFWLMTGWNTKKPARIGLKRKDVHLETKKQQKESNK
jgi:hypothetical protein